LCLVYLLDLYLSKLPSIVFEKDGMYWKPKSDISKNPSEPWYVCQPVGKHKLNGMVAQMCEGAHLHERKTNHSLRLSGTMSLYKGGVPEREILQRTGHRSLEALRKYDALEKNNIRQFQTCFPRLWNGLTISFGLMQVTPIHFHYHKCTRLFCIPVQGFITICKKSVFCSVSTWPKPSEPISGQCWWHTKC